MPNGQKHGAETVFDVVDVTVVVVVLVSERKFFSSKLSLKANDSNPAGVGEAAGKTAKVYWMERDCCVTGIIHHIREKTSERRCDGHKQYMRL